MNEQRRHEDQHRKDDRDREREVEQQRRQWKDQRYQDGKNAYGKRDVAALEEGANIAKAGSLMLLTELAGAAVMSLMSTPVPGNICPFYG